MEGEAMSETNDHAQVGALLAKCWKIEVRFGTVDKNWKASLFLIGRADYHFAYGSTQLAAIRAAVEAAEKGVRE